MAVVYLKKGRKDLIGKPIPLTVLGIGQSPAEHLVDGLIMASFAGGECLLPHVALLMLFTSFGPSGN